MSIDLRLATPADQSPLFELVRAFYAESGYPLDDAAARRALGQILADASFGRVLLASQHGEVQGYLILAFGFSIEYRGRDAIIDELYVRPEARRSGIARALLDELERASPGWDVHALHLEVEGDNTEAEGLYRRRGYAGNARRLLTKRLVPCIAALLLFALPQVSAAWGPTGHRITGEIAWRNLTPRTKDAVRELLPKGRYETLAETSAWADTDARRQPREYGWLERLHYVNADPRDDAVEASRNCGCVIGAIEIQSDRLRDPKTSHGDKVEALRLVAHFVGDVHQPLHVAHPDMRGGTTIDVRFAGKPTTLHKLWDSGLLERRLRERRGRGSRWKAHAQSLADSVTPAQRAQWTASRDPEEWASESLALSRANTFAVRENEALGDGYYDASIVIVDQRLQQSGIRLAALLNAIFDPAAPLQ